MSKSYKIDVELIFDEETPEEVINKTIGVAKQAWPLSVYDEYTLDGYRHCLMGGEDSLADDIAEETFAEALCRIILLSANRFVRVIVRAACLDDLPYTEYRFGKDEYDKLIQELPKNNGKKNGTSS